MLKNSPQGPVFTPMPPKNCWSFIRTCNTLEEKYFGDKSRWAEPLQQIRDQEKDLAFQALGMAIAFLEDALIAEHTIMTSTFFLYEPESKKAETARVTPAKGSSLSLKNMVLDA